MKYTLLDLVKTIASSMDSDEIDSINDSTESLQIATCVRTAYFDMIQRANLPEHYSLVTLDAWVDDTKPVFMTIPDNVVEIVWLKYNTLTTAGDPINMQLIKYMSPIDFFQSMHGMGEVGAGVGTFSHTIGTDTFDIFYYDDRPPTSYTTFNDRTILFDSYDSVIEDQLQKNKTICYGRTVIPFTMSDTFTPDLDEGQFTLLLNEAKSLAWSELKQTPHGIAERNSRRGWTNVQTKRHATERLHPFYLFPNYARK